MDLKNAFKNYYTMRTTGREGLSIITTVPPKVVEREAAKHGLTVNEFINQYRVVAYYDNFDGIFYRFEKPVPKEPRSLKRMLPAESKDSFFNGLRKKIRR